MIDVIDSTPPKRRATKKIIAVRLTQIQREWLFKESYDKNISQGEIVRRLLDAEKAKKK